VLLAVISDTHLPQGRRRLPPACVRVLKRADLILHAGDLFALSVLRELELHAPVAAVRGNVDQPEVRALLPDTRVVHAEGARIAMVHDAGPRDGRLERLRRRFADADAVVFGHSHLPEHRTAPDGFQVFNPGSPTERRRAPQHTMGIARARDGAVDFELVALD
jgi:putative phosphoesterase